jgi:hypothetical protein
MLMSRTYVKGRNKYKRLDCKHGHCFYCRWNKKKSMKRKTEKKKNLILEIYPYLEFFINPVSL